MTQTGARTLGQRFTVWYWAGHRKIPMWARSAKAMDVDLFTATTRYKLLSDLGFTLAMSWRDPMPGRAKMASKYPAMYTNPHGDQKPPFSRETTYRTFADLHPRELPEGEGPDPQGDGAGL